MTVSPAKNMEHTTGSLADMVLTSVEEDQAVQYDSAYLLLHHLRA